MRRLSIVLVLFLAVASGCRDRGKPVIISVEPSEFPAGGQDLVDVQGNGFQPGAKVTVGGQECPRVVFVNKKRMVALLPVIIYAGEADLAVENPDGQSAVLSGGVKFQSRLAVISAQPGFLRAGSRAVSIRISGAGFLDGAVVKFGEAESPLVQVHSEDLITAEAPELDPGIVDLTVVNPDGSEAVLAAGFQVLGKDEDFPLQEMKDKADAYGLVGDNNINESGVAIADIDRDGVLDLVITADRDFRVYKGEGKRFREITDESGIKPQSVIYGGFLGDYNNDGRPDMLLSGHPCLLYKNIGQARFEDATAETGLPEVVGWAAAWADYDADGMLDLFIGEPLGDDHLYKNTGGGFKEVFPDAFEKMSVAKLTDNLQPTTFSASFGDYDNDGYPDIFVGIRGQASRLLHNLKGKGFENVSEKLGLDFKQGVGSKGTIYKLNWGVTWADFNNDGFLDILSASGASIADLYQNREGKKFVNVTRKMRVSFTPMVLCPSWGDFDNDGWQDVAIGDNLNGVRVYRNKGDGTFRDVTMDLGIPVSDSKPMAVAWTDIDRDGALDLYVSEFLYEDRLFINSPYPGRHYLEVELEGRKSNSLGIGSMITVQAGGTILTRQISGGEAYLVSPPPIAHFGLGDTGKVERLTVRWPGGKLQTMEQVPADQLIRIVEQEEKEQP